MRWALTHAVLVMNLVVAIIAGALLTVADARGDGSMAVPPEFPTAGLDPVHVALGILMWRRAGRERVSG